MNISTMKHFDVLVLGIHKDKWLRRRNTANFNLEFDRLSKVMFLFNNQKLNTQPCLPTQFTSQCISDRVPSRCDEALGPLGRHVRTVNLSQECPHKASVEKMKTVSIHNILLLVCTWHLTITVTSVMLKNSVQSHDSWKMEVEARKEGKQKPAQSHKI